MMMIEPLEARIAPATLIDPRTVQYVDPDGDLVTVTFSKPVLTAGNANTILKFDTGSVNGDNSAQQILRTINAGSLGNAAKGMDITVEAEGDAVADVGLIRSAKADLGTVKVDGNLGRLEVGDSKISTLGVTRVEVGSLGALVAGSGQAPTTTILGGVRDLVVEGDIVEAYVRIVGKRFGTAVLIDIGGSLVGGSAKDSGAIHATGVLGTVKVGGSLLGSSGAESAQIGTSRQILSVEIGGDIVGGEGKRSGALLSTGGLGDVVVRGNVVGGSGADSGQIATAGAMGDVLVEGFVSGGTGKFTGSILSAGGIGSVTVVVFVEGGSGEGSGLIGTSGSLGDVTLGMLFGGSGEDSGSVLATGSIGAVFVEQSVVGSTGLRSGHIGSGANIASVQIGAFLEGGYEYGGNEELDILDAPPDGPVLPGGDLSGTVQALGSIGDVVIGFSIFGGGAFRSGSVIAGLGIGNVYVGFDVNGGGGFQSGSIIAEGGNIGDVEIGGSLLGAGGAESGRIGASGSVGEVILNGTLSGGSGNGSGAIAARGGTMGAVDVGWVFGGDGVGSGVVESFSAMGNVVVRRNFYGGEGEGSGRIEGGGIGDVNVNGRMIGSSLISRAGIGEIEINGNENAGTGMFGALISANGAIAGLDVYGDGDGGDGIAFSTIFAGGDLGMVRVWASGSEPGDRAVDSSIIQTLGFLEGLSLSNYGGSGEAVAKTAINARAGIGKIDLYGALVESLIVTGVGIVDGFGGEGAFLDFVGGFGDGAAAAFGFGPGNSPAAAGGGIVSIEVSAGGGAGIVSSTILAGVLGAGADGVFGTMDDTFVAGASIGSLYTDLVENSTVISGAIGAITVSGGAVTDSTFRALQPNAPGMGEINVQTVASETVLSAISGSHFESASNIAAIAASLSGDRPLSGETAVIRDSMFASGDYMGPVDVSSVMATEYYNLSAVGIENSAFYAGVAGLEGGIGGIAVWVEGGDEQGDVGVRESVFDASRGAGSTGGMGPISILVEDYNGNGVTGSKFRARGDFAAIEVSDSIGSVFMGGGNFSTVQVRGDFASSMLLSGIDLGADFALGGAGAEADAFFGGRSTGDIEIWERIIGSDIAVSVNPGATLVFGDGNDTRVGEGGMLGNLSVGSAGYDGDPGPASHGVVAAYFGDLRIGEAAVTAPFLFDYTSEGLDASDVRVMVV